MAPQVDQLFKEALSLPEYDRGALAVRLIESLDGVVEDGVEDAWSAEIQMRLDELATGHVQPVPLAEARRQILEETD